MFASSTIRSRAPSWLPRVTASRPGRRPAQILAASAGSHPHSRSIIPGWFKAEGARALVGLENTARVLSGDRAGVAYMANELGTIRVWFASVARVPAPVELDPAGAAEAYELLQTALGSPANLNDDSLLALDLLLSSKYGQNSGSVLPSEQIYEVAFARDQVMHIDPRALYLVSEGVELGQYHVVVEHASRDHAVTISLRFPQNDNVMVALYDTEANRLVTEYEYMTVAQGRLLWGMLDAWRRRPASIEQVLCLQLARRMKS
jgi:hypothetical protein